MKPLLATLPKGIISVVASDGDEDYIIISRSIPEREQFMAFRIQQQLDGEDSVKS